MCQHVQVKTFKIRYSNFKANTIDYEVEQNKGPSFKSMQHTIPVH